jgi:hypothetical protein
MGKVQDIGVAKLVKNYLHPSEIETGRLSGHHEPTETHHQ